MHKCSGQYHQRLQNGSWRQRTKFDLSLCDREKTVLCHVLLLYVPMINIWCGSGIRSSSTFYVLVWPLVVKPRIRPGQKLGFWVHLTCRVHSHKVSGQWPQVTKHATLVLMPSYDHINLNRKVSPETWISKWMLMCFGQFLWWYCYHIISF
jgi:hypothetical protein